MASLPWCLPTMPSAISIGPAAEPGDGSPSEEHEGDGLAAAVDEHALEGRNV